MVYDRSLKDKTARRLRQCREEYKEGKLSHEKLAELLSRTYEKSNDGEILKRTHKDNRKDWDEIAIISSGVLKNYELTTDKNVVKKRVHAGFGMNISYLVMFSDFYGVSVEYLLGIVDEPTLNIENKAISEKTGLSEDAINAFIETLGDNPEYRFVVNIFLATAKPFIEDIYYNWKYYINSQGYGRYLDRKPMEPFDYNLDATQKIHTSSINLDPMEFYQFRKSFLKEEFVDVLEEIYYNITEDEELDATCMKYRNSED